LASRRRGRSIEKTDAFYECPGSMRGWDQIEAYWGRRTAEGEGAAERNVGLSGKLRRSEAADGTNDAESVKNEG
jgi:hypothetical protein